MAAPSPFLTMQILWVALSASPLLVTAAMVFVRLSQPAPTVEPGIRLALLTFAGLAAFGAAPLARFVRDRLLDVHIRAPDASPFVALQKAMIIGTAICESAALLVISVYFLSGEVVVLGGLLPCYVGLYWMMPVEAQTQELARRIEEHAAKRGPTPG